MRKWSAMILAALLLLTCLAGCARSAAPQNAKNTAMDYYGMNNESATAEAPEMNAADMPMTEGDFSAPNSAEETAPVDFSEKIIYSGYVTVESTDFDTALETLNRAIGEYGGFIQNSSVEGSTRNYADGTSAVVNRWANYTVRIPAEKYRSFMAMTGTIGNVTSTSEDALNVTTQYTDYEARLNSLEIQEERLLKMLEESGDLDSLIRLEERLSEVRYEIESIERNLRDLDQRIAYSTVTVTIREVELYTPTVVVKRSFGQKLSDALSDGWHGFVRGMQNFCLFVVGNLPALILWAAVLVAVVLIIRRIVRRRRARKAAAEPKEEPKE